MGANPQYAEGEVIANKYVVEGLLGESPSGRVYLASGNFGTQKIGVKFYRPEVSAVLLSAPDFFLKAAARPSTRAFAKMERGRAARGNRVGMAGNINS